MKHRTAMQLLRQQIVGELEGIDKVINDHQKGYKQCLENLLSTIEWHSLKIEEHQIKDAFWNGTYSDESKDEILEIAQNFYDEKYRGGKP